MAYKFSSFYAVPLPDYNAVLDASTPEAHNPIVQTISGSFDFFGFDQRAFPKPHVFQLSGIYDDQTFTVAEGGDTIYDHNGVAITASTADSLIELLEDLKAKSWKVGPLIRQVLDTSGRKERKFCRLLQVEYITRSKDRGLIAPTTAIFSTLQPHWQDVDQTTVSDTLAVGANTTSVTPGGNAPIYDAVLTFDITGSVTNIDIALGDNHLVYSGSLVNTDQLIIDCGKFSVTKNGSNAYADFALGSNHADNVWLRLTAGVQNDISITMTGSTSDLDVDFYDQYF